MARCVDRRSSLISLLATAQPYFTKETCCGYALHRFAGFLIANPRILRACLKFWRFSFFCHRERCLHRVAIHTHQTNTTQSQKWILAQKHKATPMILPPPQSQALESKATFYTCLAIHTAAAHHSQAHIFTPHFTPHTPKPHPPTQESKASELAWEKGYKPLVF